MDDNFKIEIINPEKILFSESVKMVTLPSYEGAMSILKDHIPIITFLRPGIVKVQKDTQNFNEFFIQDGTVEYFDNNLVILSASVVDVKNLSKQFIDNLIQEANDQLLGKDINDHERYVLNTKLNVLKEVRL